MPTKLVRTQIMLDEKDQKRLRTLVERQGKSLSEFIRQLIKEYIEEQDRREEKDLLDALAELRQIREKSAEQYGVYEGNLVKEAREAREQQMEDVWKQQS